MWKLIRTSVLALATASLFLAGPAAIAGPPPLVLHGTERPAPLADPKGAPPDASAVWVPGHWHHRLMYGEWVWEPGFWEQDDDVVDATPTSPPIAVDTRDWFAPRAGPRPRE